MVGVAQKETLGSIVKSDIMIADVSVVNPNVMYQLGVRHVASCGLTILMSDEPYPPFNTSNIAGMLRYTQSPEGFRDLRVKLARVVKEGMGHKGNRSPIHRLFPELQPTISKELCIFIGNGRNALWAIVLKQEGTEDFSNIAGLQCVSFMEAHIDQTFYELQRVLAREGMVS